MKNAIKFALSAIVALLPCLPALAQPVGTSTLAARQPAVSPAIPSEMDVTPSTIGTELLPEAITRCELPANKSDGLEVCHPTGEPNSTLLNLQPGRVSRVGVYLATDAVSNLTMDASGKYVKTPLHVDKLPIGQGVEYSVELLCMGRAAHAHLQINSYGPVYDAPILDIRKTFQHFTASHVLKKIYSNEPVHDILTEENREVAIKADQWTTCSISCRVPIGTKGLWLYASNYGWDNNPAPLTIRKLSCRVVSASEAGDAADKQTTEYQDRRDDASADSRLIKVSLHAEVSPVRAGRSGTVTFPVPGTYRGQYPLCFDLRTSPASMLKGFRWKLRPDKVNWICEIRVRPPAKGGIIMWKALVLVANDSPQKLFKTNRPEVPSSVAKWTRSTACVQSADKTIVSKAAELAVGTNSIEGYARRVVNFMGTNPGNFSSPQTLDALAGLDSAGGGSCTSCANLAAALLRARGIPARTVSLLPTFGDPYFEHWNTDYWHPGVGWIRIEPTMNQVQPSRSKAVVLSIANPEDENLAFDPVHQRLINAGAPYLSSCELTSTLTEAPDIPQAQWEVRGFFKDFDGGNPSVMVARFNASPIEKQLLLKAAAQVTTLLLSRCRHGIETASYAVRLTAASKSGDPIAFIKCLEKIVNNAGARK